MIIVRPRSHLWLLSTPGLVAARVVVLRLARDVLGGYNLEQAKIFEHVTSK